MRLFLKRLKPKPALPARLPPAGAMARFLGADLRFLGADLTSGTVNDDWQQTFLTPVYFSFMDEE
jgi:hypothetical protein